MRGVLSSTPLDLVDLFLDLEGFEVVKFGFMGLKFSMEFVFTSFLLSEGSASLTMGRATK